MLLQLPTELVERCIEFAVFPTTTTNSKTLLSLLLTCHSLYKITIPYLYDTHILHINPDLYTGVARTRDYRENLYPDHPPPCFVPPTSLHTLLVLPRNQAPASLPHDHDHIPEFPSIPLIKIFNKLTALKTLVYIPKECPQELAASIHALPLTSLTCSFHSTLIRHAFPDRPKWRLQSLTLHSVSSYPLEIQNLIETFASTLTVLSMSYKTKIMSTPGDSFAPLPVIPALRHLRLHSYSSEVMIGVQTSVDFGRLETLQLASRRDASVVPDTIKKSGGLAALRKLSVHMSPQVLVPVLEMCTSALEELHVVWLKGGENTGMSAAVAEVLARRCSGLKAVSLDMGGEFQRFWGGCEMAMKKEDLGVMARACPGIEDLFLSVNLHDFGSTTSALPLFPALRHLYITLHNSPGTNHYDSIPLIPLSMHPWRLDLILDRATSDEQEAATQWALDQVVSQQDLDSASVIVPADLWIRKEWVKPGADLTKKEVQMSPLRRCLRWLPTAGVGRWNTAFEPLWFGGGREETGVLIAGS